MQLDFIRKNLQDNPEYGEAFHLGLENALEKT